VTALTTRDFTEASDPFALFTEWLAAAQASEPNDPNAMALATVDAEGMPDVRMVLLKAATPSGFVFYTHRESAKGGELDGNKAAAAVFHWKSLRRQVRIRGRVEFVSTAEADAYHRSRQRQSQLGAWASRQSRPLESRLVLEAAVAEYAQKFAQGEVPRPDYWVGYRILPLTIEFWSDGAFRLHDRISFRRKALDAAWTKERLYP
jgi:pyridoxamine 5'-phosphate oxidase